MLGLYLAGVLLWLAYGVLVRAQAVILTNVATAILITIATTLKAWTARRSDRGENLRSTVAEAESA